MNLGRAALCGGIGGVIGIAAQIGLEAYTGYQIGWMAPVIGALTGIGVRSATVRGNQTAGSYGLSALAGIIALASIVGANFASSEVTQRRFADAGSPSQILPNQPEVASPARDVQGTDSDSNEEIPASPASEVPLSPPINPEAPASESDSDGATAADDSNTDDTSAGDKESSVGLDNKSDNQEAPSADHSNLATKPTPVEIPSTAIATGDTKVGSKSVLSSVELLWFTLGTAIAYVLGGTAARPQKEDEQQAA